MGDIFKAIVGILGASPQIKEYVIIPIKNQYSYLFRHNKIIEGLRGANGELNASRDYLQIHIRAADNNLQVINPLVPKWCTDVDELKGKIDTILGDESQVENGACMHGTCPNLKLRYLRSRKAMELTADAVKLQKEYTKFRIPKSVPATLMEMDAIPATSDTRELDSRRSKEEEIVSYLRENSIRMIGVWGMGGVGKTTMAKKIAKNAIEEKLFDEIAMAVVSQQVDVRRIQQELAEGLGLTLTEEAEHLRAGKLCTRLKDKKVLIILDDVWECLDLEKVGIPSQMKILLTTRDNQVCRMMSIEGATEILELKVLGEEEAFSLFRENAGCFVDQSNLQPLARDVAKECNGLPLALVTVGRSLRGETNVSTWEDSLRQLRQSAPVNIRGYLKHVFQSLELSYKHLESEQARYLFLLCCLFPEDSEIGIEILVRYGKALGMFSNTESINDTRKSVNRIVKMLIDRCLLMLPWPTNVKMHDVIRDVALYIASSGKHVFKVIHDIGLREWPENDSGEDYTCISLTLGEPMSFPECIRCPRLNAILLTFDSPTLKPELPDYFLNEIPDLRLLSICPRPHRSSHMMPLSLSFLCPLKKLRALRLDGCDLENIYLIGQVVSLEILSCRGSGIRVLPNEIGALAKLKLLDLTHSRFLRNIAPGVIPKLVQLEELRLMNCPIEWKGKEEGKKRSNASLAEVFSLRNLRFLEIWIQDSEVISQETDPFQKLTCYYVLIGKREAAFNLEGSYTDLKRLEVCVDERKVGVNAISMLLKDVEDLHLRGNGSKDVIDLLARQGFESTKYLNIVGLNSVKHLGADGDIFSVLRHLQLRDMNDLEEICDGHPSLRSFSLLEYLSLVGLGNLKWVFPLSVAESLWRLQSINVRDCQMLEEVFKDERGSEIGVTTINPIKFPSLKRMILDRLPMLCALCKAVDVFEFPSMETLSISEINQVSTKSLLVKQLGQITCPNLQGLRLEKLKGSGQLFSHEIPIASLRELRVECCENLKSLFTPRTFGGLTNLEGLWVKDCLMLEEVIGKEDVDDEGGPEVVRLPKLQYLSLEKLPKLRGFCEMQSDLELPSLESISMINCTEMTTFYVGGGSVCMPKGVRVDGIEYTEFASKLFFRKVTCPNLQMLWLKTLKVSGQLFSHEIPIASLRILSVECCENLKSLFTPTFGGLTNLEELVVGECLMLEGVIGKEDVDDEGSPEVFRLPKLQYLTLEELPKLRGFCEMHSGLELPSLQKITVRNCIEMTTFNVGGGSVCMPKGVRVDGIEDTEFASKLFFKEEHCQEEEDNLDNGCFILFPRDLSFTIWSGCETWLVKGLSDVFFHGGWEKVCGTFDMAKLSTGIVYEIAFVLMLLQEPVQGFTPELEIKLGDDKQIKKVRDMPRRQWIEMLAGELRPSSAQCGQVTFSLEKNWNHQKVMHMEIDLLLKEVRIRPKETIAQLLHWNQNM